MGLGKSEGGRNNKASDIKGTSGNSGVGEIFGNPLALGFYLCRCWNESNAGYCVTEKGITCD